MVVLFAVMNDDLLSFFRSHGLAQADHAGLVDGVGNCLLMYIKLDLKNEKLPFVIMWLK